MKFFLSFLFFFMPSFAQYSWNLNIAKFLEEKGCKPAPEGYGVMGSPKIYCDGKSCYISNTVCFFNSKKCKIQAMKGCDMIASKMVKPYKPYDAISLCDFVRIESVNKKNASARIVPTDSGQCPILIKDLNSPFFYNDYGVIFLYVKKEGDKMDISSYSDPLTAPNSWIYCDSNGHCKVFILDKSRCLMGYSNSSCNFYKKIKSDQIKIDCKNIEFSDEYDSLSSARLNINNEGLCKIEVEYRMNLEMNKATICLDIKKEDGKYKAYYSAKCYH